MASNSIAANTNSSSVLLDDVDDYLAPSQACINPLFQSSSSSDTKKEEPLKGDNVSKKEIATPAVVVPRRRRRVVRRPVVLDDPTPDEDTAASASATASAASKSQPNEAVKASMADCLACSGCVTTAETVMLEQHHSLASLRKRLTRPVAEGNRRLRVITLSPNAWADLCRHWKLPDTTRSLAQITVLLHTVLQANVLVDGNVPLEWTWQTEGQEFVDAYRTKNDDRVAPGSRKDASNAGTCSPPLPPPSTALDSKRTVEYHSDGTTHLVDHTRHARPSTQLPLLSGSCPALVCLVEKSMHALVPHLSQTTSPMTRMGLVLKSTTSNQGKNEPITTAAAAAATTIEWDHWAVMPCHDKKLEASRKDFLLSPSNDGISKKKQKKEDDNDNDDDDGVMAVDLVIATSELVELVEEWRQQQQEVPTSFSFSDQRLGNNMADYFQSLNPAPVYHSSSAVPPPMTADELVATYFPMPGPSSSSSSSSSSSAASSPCVLWTTHDEAIALATTTQDNVSSLSRRRIAFSSGGHANYIFRFAANALFGYDAAKAVHDILPWESTTAAAAAAAAALSGKNSTTNGIGSSGGTVIIKSARLAKQQLRQQSYQVGLYRNKADGSLTTTRPTIISTTSTTSATRTALEDDYETLLRFGIVHGMQTMQRTLTELPANNSDRDGSSSGGGGGGGELDYLEAMACPHGCVNGGGSVRLVTSTEATEATASETTTAAAATAAPSDGGSETATTTKPGVLVRETPTETKRRVGQTLQHLRVVAVSAAATEASTSVAAVAGAAAGDIGAADVVVQKEDSSMLLPYQTRYHVVPPMQYGMGAAAGVKVQDMQW